LEDIEEDSFASIINSRRIGGKNYKNNWALIILSWARRKKAQAAAPLISSNLFY
jgi:hypothetical protein